MTRMDFLRLNVGSQHECHRYGARVTGLEFFTIRVIRVIRGATLF
jgi:hypothetical protein